MMLNEIIEYANGLQGQVVGLMPPHHFILLSEGRYAGCHGDAEEFSFCNEEEPWRDSLMDASCDIEIDIQESLGND